MHKSVNERKMLRLTSAQSVVVALLGEWLLMTPEVSSLKPVIGKLKLNVYCQLPKKKSPGMAHLKKIN